MSCTIMIIPIVMIVHTPVMLIRQQRDIFMLLMQLKTLTTIPNQRFDFSLL